MFTLEAMTLVGPMKEQEFGPVILAQSPYISGMSSIGRVCSEKSDRKLGIVAINILDSHVWPSTPRKTRKRKASEWQVMAPPD
jgi:hypothetical protein